MKTMIVLSDSHGNADGVRAMQGRFAENDYVVHLGDGFHDMREVRKEYPMKVHQVVGNCDFCYGMREAELSVEGVDVFFCHGHLYGVKKSLADLAAEAKRRGCALALYGHTHEPLVTQVEGVTLVNPGSFNRYEQNYAYIVFNRGKFTVTLVSRGEKLV